jgi:hypothetical protein
MADELAMGRELRAVRSLDLGRCMDAELVGDLLYVIGGAKLHVFDASTPADPQRLGSIGGLGGTRQIVVRGKTAYVTSREDGLFIVDVADPAKPELLSHYDTIELATGIEVSGSVAYVACRTYGVELIDVRSPAKPRHLSTVRTGEAQSCVVRDGILYVGVWHSRELVICDVRNPWQPTVMSRSPLDGYGDGLTLRGNYCYAATGHHARGMRKRDESDPAYATGHGLDILDISDPAKPTFVSRCKMPRFYSIGMDMWDVAVRGDYAVVGDTHNGVFVVNIADLTKPTIVGHRQLPIPKGKEHPDAVGGFAVGKGVVYVAGSRTGLQVVEAPEVQPDVRYPDTPPAIPPTPKPDLPAGFQTYRPAGQVWAVAMHGEVARAACGAGGIHTVAIDDELKGLAMQPTTGFALDVKTFGNYVYVAESEGGLSIWEAGKDHALRLVGRLKERNRPIRQVVLTPDGKRALLAAGKSHFLVADVSDVTKPEVIFRDKRHGLLYGYQVAPGLTEGRYALCFWHVAGAFWYDVGAGEPAKWSGDSYPHRLGSMNGFVVLPDGKRMLCTTRKGTLAVIDRAERRPMDELTQYGIKGADLRGKPTIYGNRLYIADRFFGRLVVVDITDLAHPRLLARYQFAANPGLVVEHLGKMLVPGGYDGLLVAPVPGRR